MKTGNVAYMFNGVLLSNKERNPENFSKMGGFGDIILSEMSHKQMAKYCMFSLIYAS